jgi:hypothetical protein
MLMGRENVPRLSIAGGDPKAPKSDSGAVTDVQDEAEKARFRALHAQWRQTMARLARAACEEHVRGQAGVAAALGIDPRHLNEMLKGDGYKHLPDYFLPGLAEQFPDGYVVMRTAANEIARAAKHGRAAAAVDEHDPMAPGDRLHLISGEVGEVHADFVQRARDGEIDEPDADALDKQIDDAIRELQAMKLDMRKAIAARRAGGAK